MAFAVTSKVGFSNTLFKGTQLKQRTAIVQKAVSKTVRAEEETAEEPAAPPPPPKFCLGLAGNTGPCGDFDPAGFLNDKDANTIKRYREAEVTHGRVCMLASVGLIVNENFNPLFDGKITGPAINQFQQVPFPFWFALLGAVGAAELRRARIGWVNPVGENTEPGSNNLFTLNEDYTPGDIGYDPLGLKPTDAAELREMQNKELNNGRLAMIATAGMMVQELITQEKLF